MVDGGWERSGPQAKRILSGGLAASTNTRLREVLGWGGSSAVMAPGELIASSSVGVHPISQVIGLDVRSESAPQLGGRLYSRPTTTEPESAGHSWREDPYLVQFWDSVRRRALKRLTLQAEMLAASAVIGVQGRREGGSLCFTGTAVRIDSWTRRTSPPPLTTADGAQLTAMLRAGVEPAGIVGGFACVETFPSRTTRWLLRGGRRRSSVELEDLTGAIYEVRRLALRRLIAAAQGVEAHGVVGVNFSLERAGSGRTRLSPWTLAVHVVASAVRRTGTAELRVEPVLGVGGRHV